MTLNYKMCYTCKESKAKDLFVKNIDRCKSCHNKSGREWKRKNKEKTRISALKYKYGLEYTELISMQETQSNKCYICQKSPLGSRYNKLCVDHDHRTGNVRKLLCNNCNAALGLLNDNILLLENIIKYLDKYNGK